MHKPTNIAFFFIAVACTASCATVGSAAKGPSGLIDHETQYRVACHEAGHAVVAAVLRPLYPVTSIVVRTELVDGSPFGTTNHADVNRLETVQDLIDEAVEDMAGREAETALLGKPTNGGTMDLVHANRLFQNMCTVNGLCGSLRVQDQPSAAAEKKIVRCLDLAKSRARVLAEANAETIRELAVLLMSMPEISNKRTLDVERWRIFLKGRVLVREAEAHRPPVGTCP